jgi:hypothetical protein
MWWVPTRADTLIHSNLHEIMITLLSNIYAQTLPGAELFRIFAGAAFEGPVLVPFRVEAFGLLLAAPAVSTDFRTVIGAPTTGPGLETLLQNEQRTNLSACYPIGKTEWPVLVGLFLFKRPSFSWPMKGSHAISRSNKLIDGEHLITNLRKEKSTQKKDVIAGMSVFLEWRTQSMYTVV